MCVIESNYVAAGWPEAYSEGAVTSLSRAKKQRRQMLHDVMIPKVLQMVFNSANTHTRARGTRATCAIWLDLK